ncbi:IS110 family transposase [Mucilaginibacter flavus]|uniref:IS110 family transposase n=1 Tax=Mucilaginibacter flavus TaxID=931504 RepID=UPI0025B6121A|nr:IS110 family transposase [Mucilaginibacter flavus]MDN3583803.1 IS110 family transposase [Mucilaginibacter flavus]
MTNILKQVVGIDVAQNELVVSLGNMDQAVQTSIYAFKQFANKPSGFKALETWVSKHTDKQVPVRYVMEATGVYHEKLAYHLSGQGAEVSIVLPNKVSNYMRTLDTKTVTDKTASQAICKFGLERKQEIWQQPKKIFRDLKQLTRERDQIIAERTVSKNQLHAEQAEAFPNEKSLKRLNTRIDLCNMQEREIKEDIAAIIKQDKELFAKINNVTTIPGVGALTVVIALAETNGFDLIGNKSQLTSYSGLDVEEKESGTSVKKKPKISKKGNRHLRKAMHMPALTAIRIDDRFKVIYARLISRHGIKMKAAVAIQRRLLELIYILWTTNKPYDKNHVHQSIESTKTI